MANLRNQNKSEKLGEIILNRILFLKKSRVKISSHRQQTLKNFFFSLKNLQVLFILVLVHVTVRVYRYYSLFWLFALKLSATRKGL
jgi:hypothetical protein